MLTFPGSFVAIGNAIGNEGRRGVATGIQQMYDVVTGGSEDIAEMHRRSWSVRVTS